MQETRSNSFGSKTHSTTLRQAKTGKHECRKMTAMTGRSDVIDEMKSYVK